LGIPRGAGISIIAGADIHIFVFTDCKNNRFQNKLIGQNTNIWISAPPIIDIPAPLVIPTTKLQIPYRYFYFGNYIKADTDTPIWTSVHHYMWVTYSCELGSNKMNKTTLGTWAKWAIPFNICTPLSRIGIRSLYHILQNILI
jgi:hypothetical protein